MNSFNLGTEVKFSAAHFLVDYDGPCSEIHGHTWKVEVEYNFNDVWQLPSNGILVDFAEIKGIIKENFDHTLLNDHPLLDNIPTAEKLADVILGLLPKLDGVEQTIFVTVWESDVSWVRAIGMFGDFTKHLHRTTVSFVGTDVEVCNE